MSDPAVQPPPTSRPSIARKPTTVDGVEVIATEAAMVRHPRWGWERPTVMQGAVKALLADGREEVVCNDCDFHNPNPVAVQSHRNGTHVRRAPHIPLTDVKIIRAVLRAVERAKTDGGGRNFCERAAAALNEAGLKPALSAEWSSTMVSRIYRKYHGRYPVRVRRSEDRDLSRFPTLPAIPTPGLPSELELAQIAATVGQADQALADEFRRIAEDLVRIARALVAIADNWPPPPVIDPEILEKAAKYDQLRGLIS